jgi:hypothetical protein
MAFRGLVVFLLAFAYDALWAACVRRVQSGPAVAAANAAVLLSLIGCAGTIGYVHEHWLMVPYAAGCWLGTWWSVRNARRSEGTPPRSGER